MDTEHGAGSALRLRARLGLWASSLLALLLSLTSIAWALDLYRAAGLRFLTEQFLAAVLTLCLVLIFLTRRITPALQEKVGPTPWYDIVVALAAFVTGLGITFAYPMLIANMFALPLWATVMCWSAVLLIVEALRRTSGLSLVLVILVVCGYSLVGHLVDGPLQTRRIDLNDLMIYLAIDSSGIFGVVLLIGATVVVPFVFFGNLLTPAGGASFFSDLSVALMGRFRGGAAKIAVIGSTLFGSFSGVVVSNLMATGVITIPLMKRSGFKPEEAAAVEASASNGAQFVPPVMGAVAFLMADFLQISYAEVAIAAIIPALLYYFSLFVQVDLLAARRGIARVSADQIPRVRKVLRSGSHFFIPFALLIYALFQWNREPENAAMLACGAVIAVGIVLGYAGERLTLADIFRALVRTGESATDIIMISAAAGIIIGTLQITGLGFALTLLLVNVGAGNTFFLLALAAFMCILLGMGMPTLGVYVLLAVLVAPALVEVGIPPLAAHMFILYLGMMSFITPPIAIAAFFAANMAGAKPFRTSLLAMQFSWTAYLVPFMFVFSPTLLFQGTTIGHAALVICISASAIWFMSAALVGQVAKKISLVTRAAFLLCGCLLIVPWDSADFAPLLNAAGLAIGAALLCLEYARTRRGAAGEKLAAGDPP